MGKFKYYKLEITGNGQKMILVEDKKLEKELDAKREALNHVYTNDQDLFCDNCESVRYLTFEIVNGAVIITGCDKEISFALAVNSFVGICTD